MLRSSSTEHNPFLSIMTTRIAASFDDSLLVDVWLAEFPRPTPLADLTVPRSRLCFAFVA